VTRLDELEVLAVVICAGASLAAIAPPSDAKRRRAVRSIVALMWCLTAAGLWSAGNPDSTLASLALLMFFINAVLAMVVVRLWRYAE